MKRYSLKARAFRSRSEIKQMARVLWSNLSRADSSRYRINNIDHTVASNLSLEETIRDLKALGYTQPFPPRWKMHKSLKNACIMGLNGEYPLVVRESIRGWGANLILVGHSFPTFRTALRPLQSHLLAEPIIGLSMLLPGVPRLQMECDVDCSGTGSTVEQLLTDQGFSVQGDVLFNKKLGLLAACTDGVVTFLDSQL